MQYVVKVVNLDTFNRHTMNACWKGNNDIGCAMCYGVLQSKKTWL